MKLASLILNLTKLYPGLVENSVWGETALFYNPSGLLKRGTYCITFKEKDGENDASSALNREEVEYRMNLKISKPTFLTQFNEPSLPGRPAKGNMIALKSGRAFDPTVLDTLIPHPVYGWMSWISIINPSKESIEVIMRAGLLDESYEAAVAGYNKNKTVQNGASKRKENATANEEEQTASRKKSKFA